MHAGLCSSLHPTWTPYYTDIHLLGTAEETVASEIVRALEIMLSMCITTKNAVISFIH